MNTSRMIARMESFPGAVRAACSGLTPEDALYRADAKSWSILEIVCHLADEEELDFPTRLERTLNDPGAPWEPIDPEGWAVKRRHRDANLAEQLDRFASLRARRIAWLRTLENPDWSTTHQHPKLGAMRAGDLMGAWGAHDALHLRQISKRLYELALRDAKGYRTDYAGLW
ncbi:MAG: DinB family protein [Phycisphaerales bacterium]